ncbi:MAG: hypothetical protein H6907_02265 [Hyphomicrobiales bacterium]|nr:hypothetical protein [Hyphomicrobiales bacterium]MCP5370531.1 hypothetical protein [Hyphomicrobiales bacterium]
MDASAFAPNGIGFALLASGLILLAWSRFSRLFLPALGVASLVAAAAWSGPAELAALVLFLVPPYVAARAVWGHEGRQGTRLAMATIAWQVALFAVLRGYPFVDLLGWLGHPLAVVGLSYILFRQIHLILEAPFLGDLPLDPWRYLTFLLAFWTLLAGPIQRYPAFVEGLAAVGRPGNDAALAAGHRVVNGLIKAFLLAPVFLKSGDVRLLQAPGSDWLDFAVLFYSFPVYLYLNFSGYTDVMIGVARLCGVTTLPENFNRPYLARNVQDFWARWHMSFSSWIQHYLFNPLAKYLVGRAPRHGGAMTALAVMVTFLLLGAWHGTTANYLVFGLLHGVGVIAVALWGEFLKARLGRAGRKALLARTDVRVVATVVTFHYVCATLMVFNTPLDRLAIPLAIPLAWLAG